jgi:amidase
LNLCLTPAVSLAGMLRDRSLSARELLTAYLDRIERLNPALNAIITLDAERGLAQAAALDERAAHDEFAGPLHGLPIAIKDLAETAGMRTTYGSPVYAAHVPDVDAPHVALLRRAGAVVFGKTNTPEFGAGSQTFNPVFGVTRNPWDTALTPGGSSGGAAAAVASGMLPFADGSDLAASVRNPASFCGLTGLRPTPGLIPADVLEPLAVVGPLARTAADAALLLAGMCGQDAGLPLARPDRPADFLGLGPGGSRPGGSRPGGSRPGGLRPGGLRGLRVAWTADLGDLPVSPEVAAVLDRFRGQLADAGCLVSDAFPPLSDADEVFQVLRAVIMAGLGPLLRDHPAQVKQTLAWNIRKGLALTGPQIADARARQAQIFARMKAFLSSGSSGSSDYDVLALPTAQVLPFPVEQEWISEINGVPQETYIDWMRSCSRITVTLHPAISVPAGYTEAGLPAGVQLVGRYGADLQLLRIAAAISEVVPPRWPA